jgi:acetyl esterase/lipase
VIRAATVVATALRGGGPPCESARIVGFDALVARPAGGAGPVVVYANACTPRGIEQPAVGRLLSGLARAGFVAVAPELPNVKDGKVTAGTVDALVHVARASGQRVALLGASTGAGLAILAAGDPRLAERVTAVGAVAPCASLRSMLQLGTTGTYGREPFAASSLVARVMKLSLAAVAPDDPAVPALLANLDAERFDQLYAALTPETRSLVEELSPIARIGDVLAPVEIVSSPSDRFCPAGEARVLAEAGSDVRLTVTTGLEHVLPRANPGLARVLLALERTLRHAASEPTPVLRPSLAA